MRAPLVLEYLPTGRPTTGAKLMLSLTLYFFGGFLALMFTLACVACLSLIDELEGDVGGLVLWSVATAIGAIMTARCGHLVWLTLRVDHDDGNLMDSRLDD